MLKKNNYQNSEMIPVALIITSSRCSFLKKMNKCLELEHVCQKFQVEKNGNSEVLGRSLTKNNSTM